MKLLFITSFLFIFGVHVNAQFTGLKGVTVQANTMLFIQDNEPKSKSVDMIYAVSFTDKTLAHVIYSSGSVSESQIYQIQNNESFVDDSKNTIYRFDAVSGISGN